MSEQFTVFVFVVISVIVAMMIPVFLVAAAVRRTMRMQQNKTTWPSPRSTVDGAYGWCDRSCGR